MTKNDKKLLIELICEKQTKMIATKYSSEKYKHLEKLKVLIKDM